MSKPLTIYIDLTPPGLGKHLRDLLTDDWSLGAILVGADIETPVGGADIAIVDRPDAIPQLSKPGLIIFAGSPEDADACPTAFSHVLPDATEIHHEVSRAYRYLEILQSNMEASQSAAAGQDAARSAARALSERIRLLSRQVEMRSALVEQLPAGVVGVDDEGMVVLVNTAARELLNTEDVLFYGSPVELVFPAPIVSLLHSAAETETKTVFGGTAVTVRKAPFKLDGQIAGHILLFWEDEETS